MELTGRLAAVTGGAVRVGRSIVLELARRGCDVLIHYHCSENQAAGLAEEVRRLGRRCFLVQADLAEPERACQAILSGVDAGPGRADVLVNNAAVYWPGRAGEMDADQWRRMLAVNQLAPTLLADRLAERMAGHGGGAIVNILDIQARRPHPRYLAYAQTKAALWAATVGLARSAAPAVRVNGVAPGVVLWNDREDPPDKRQAWIEKIPLHRAGRPEDVASAVRFLCENDYMTGQVLCVDGGRSIG